MGLGVCGLAGGLFLESAPLVALGGWSLFAGVTIAALDNTLVVAHVIRARQAMTRSVV